MYQAIHLGLRAKGSRELNLVIDIKSLILHKLTLSRISNGFESHQKFTA